MRYSEFFRGTTGHEPFPFQLRFRAETAPHTILKTPTGLGKSDAVLVAWLDRRVQQPGTTPRRLVWCLPGRALVEQVHQDACRRVETAGLAGSIRVCRLMGGSEDNSLTLGPEESAILVGTQDMLLSRALNRGYARRPARWPIDFALLNNDCFWVLDEVQLLGDGLATSTQLAAFRSTFGSFGQAPCCWISATFDPAWLQTVDFTSPPAVIELDAEDLAHPVVRARRNAAKTLGRAPAACRLPKGAAEFLATNHAAGTLTLAVTNTVPRAREIATSLANATQAEIVLLHSRFRAPDRAARMERLKATLPAEGRIVVATQVVEAGLDLSAALMLTDAAPYASLVQRFGRVNRQGEFEQSRIFWVDRPLTTKRRTLAEAKDLKPAEEEKVWLPYQTAEVQAAIALLGDSASPSALPPVNAAPPWEHVLRRADLLDLFDTTPDLAGNEIDISRFVRSGEERDVYVAWREWPGGERDEPPDDLSDIDEAELCRVPVGDFREFAKKHEPWSWNTLEGRWMKPENIYPGITLLLHSKSGGYTPKEGWLPDSARAVPVVAGAKEQPESHDDDRRSYASCRQSLAGHSEDVAAAMRDLLASLRDPALEPYAAALATAARQHDWGKAHPVMQHTLHNGDGPYAELLAKQERSLAAPRHSRRYFRHELASALAMLAAGEEDLAAYLAAAHHGRVRVSIRSMPGEHADKTPLARGVREGDELLPADLGDGIVRPVVTLSLGWMALGRTQAGPSWTDRVLRLRDTLGPFRLAYLELLLRSADERASRMAAMEVAQ